MLPLAIRAIGCKAHAALERSGGMLAAVTGFDNAPYARAGGEIIWIGTGEVAMHPRAVVLHDANRPVAGARLSAGARTPWRPARLPVNAGAAAVRERCAWLHRDLMRIGEPVGEPRGFAAMLAGRAPDFPLDRAAPRVHQLARAFHADGIDAVYGAALPLLGLGPGLTPSGDDVVGAALFARQAIAGSPAEATAWNDLALRLVDAAGKRSHAIGAALFGDLAMGESFAPLHELAAALAAAGNHERAIDAARALVAIGHSSGWEMLAGFFIGITGTLSPYRQTRESNR